MFNNKGKNLPKLLEKSIRAIETLNYSEQFLDTFNAFFSENLPVTSATLFMLNQEETAFLPHPVEGTPPPLFKPVPGDSNMTVYLKNTQKAIIMEHEKPSRRHLLEKCAPELFQLLKVDMVIPLICRRKLHGFVVIEANHKTHKEREAIAGFFKIFANILIPMVVAERIQLENSRNYYKIFRMDRLAMVGELAASAAHEIKNPLAGISTFLKYFSQLEDFSKQDINDELGIMKNSVQRIDGIVKSLLSFSRFKKKEIRTLSLNTMIDASLQAIALKIPKGITVIKKTDEDFLIESDSHQIQQVLVNVLFNAVEAIGPKEGTVTISTYVSGRDQLPSKELFIISIKDTGPGIADSFKEKLFQPFHTTKEEGTGLGLYTCYGLMKSLGGGIKINSNSRGTEVLLSLPYSCEE